MAPVAEVSRTAMEFRLLGERSLFVAQRYPYLMNWYGEQALYDAMATPESQEGIKSVASFASSANRLADTLERLPNTDALRQTLAELNATLDEVGPLLGAMRGVIGDWNQTLNATDRMLAPFQSRAIGGGPPERTFDVSQYAGAIRDLGAAARELNALLVNTNRLVESPGLGQSVGQVHDLADSSLGRLAKQGDEWIDRVFWRAAAMLVAFFASLFAYRLAATRIVLRHPRPPHD